MINLDCLDGINIISDHLTPTTTVAANDTPSTEDGTSNQTNTSSKQLFSISKQLNTEQTESSNYLESLQSVKNERSNNNLLTCMLITANVGTIFEESNLLELWFQQLKSYLEKVKPQLVAIHCQEVGGKNYESSMKHVSNFTNKIIGDEAIVNDYTRIRIFLDENFESLEKFTALGSLYLIQKSVTSVKLYNFKTAQYDPVEDIKVYNGSTINKATAEHIEKIKFPQKLFPECRWSRKGFMRTRWLFNDSQPLDLVNIHLFHDASNLVAMKTTPSPYAQNRQQALEFALDRLSTPLEGTWNFKSEQWRLQNQQVQNEVPLFIFGDFNFRLNTNKVIQRITDGAEPIIKRSDREEVLEFVYRKPSTKANDNMSAGEIDSKKEVNSDDSIVMTVGKKLFDCENLDETFRASKNTEWLLELDNELDCFKDKLFEFKVSFNPSYPFKEDTSGGYSYMKTRCPAWCDRILFNAAGSNLIYSRNVSDDGSSSSGDKLSSSLSRSMFTSTSEKRIKQIQDKGDVLYRLMGNSVPMGDHKPVLLYCQLNLSSQACINNNTDGSNNNNINISSQKLTN